MVDRASEPSSRSNRACNLRAIRVDLVTTGRLGIRKFPLLISWLQVRVLHGSPKGGGIDERNRHIWRSSIFP
jgi:hypothetical protein